MHFGSLMSLFFVWFVLACLHVYVYSKFMNSVVIQKKGKKNLWTMWEHHCRAMSTLCYEGWILVRSLRAVVNLALTSCSPVTKKVMSSASTFEATRCTIVKVQEIKRGCNNSLGSRNMHVVWCMYVTLSLQVSSECASKILFTEYRPTVASKILPTQLKISAKERWSAWLGSAANLVQHWSLFL